MRKKIVHFLVSCFCSGMIVVSVAMPVLAFEASDATAEQQAVLKSFTQKAEIEQSETKDPKASSTYYRWSYYRGSFLAWTKDYVGWNVSNNKITSSSGWQEGGWIFPNKVKLKGISKIKSQSNYQQYRAQKSIGAGTITKWGHVDLYEIDVTDYLNINSAGKMYLS